jgi:hypothetical protein
VTHLIDGFWMLVWASSRCCSRERMAIGALEALRTHTTTIGLLAVPIWWAIAIGAACFAATGLAALYWVARFAGARLMAEEFVLAGTGFAALLLLIALRCPIGLAMLLVGIGGYVWTSSTRRGCSPILKTTPFNLFANYTLSVIPLFILMGALAERGGLARDLFTAANALVGHRRGGMAMA